MAIPNLLNIFSETLKNFSSTKWITVSGSQSGPCCGFWKGGDQFGSQKAEENGLKIPIFLQIKWLYCPNFEVNKSFEVHKSFEYLLQNFEKLLQNHILKNLSSKKWVNISGSQLVVYL